MTDIAVLASNSVKGTPWREKAQMKITKVDTAARLAEGEPSW